MKNNDTFIIILSKKNHIIDQINLIDDEEKKEEIKILYNKRIFYFTSNSITNENLNSDHNIKYFWQKQIIAAKFNTYAINLRFTTKLDDTFNYKFYF